MINLRIPAREMSSTEGMYMELWPRRAQVSTCRNRSGGKDHNSGWSAQVLLCLLRGCVCVCVCVYLSMHQTCGHLSVQDTVKANKDRWGAEIQKQQFYFSVKMCKSCSRTQCNWKHTRQRRRKGFLGQIRQAAGKRKSNWQLRRPQRR